MFGEGRRASGKPFFVGFCSTPAGVVAALVQTSHVARLPGCWFTDLGVTHIVDGANRQIFHDFYAPPSP